MIGRIFKNTFWLSVSEVVNKGLGLILIIYLARYLGSAGFGKFSFAMAFVLLFGVLADFGFSTITTREVARNKKLARKYIDNISILKLGLSVITLILIFVVIQFFNKGSEVEMLVYLAGIWVIITSYTQFFIAIFRANERMQYESLVNIFGKIILVVLVLSAIFWGFGLITFLWLYILSAIIALILALILVRIKFSGFWGKHFKIDKNLCKFIVNESWPLAIGFAFTSVYFYIDTVILAIYASDSIVGFYNAAYKIILFLMVGRRLLLTSILPVISRYYIESKVLLKRLITLFEKLSIALAFPLMTGGYILGEKLILIIYGQEYIGAIIAFQVLIFAVGIHYINLLFPTTLHATNNQKKYFRVVGTGAVLNVALNFILIPYFGMIGAGIATLFSEILVFVCAYIYVNKIIKVRISDLFLKPFIASIVMGLILFFLIDMNLFLLIVIGTIVYLLVLFLIKGMTIQDLKSMSNIDR